MHIRHQARTARFGIEVTHHPHRAVSHTVAGTTEGKHGVTPRGLLGKLNCSLNRIGTRWATELDHTIFTQGLRQKAFHGLDEMGFRFGCNIQSLVWQTRVELCFQCLIDFWMVITEHQSTCTG
ncbi:Uncharacterised protein [Vibrio cholerae]|nr:Uncharacterised protein [Vibrio cholerae]CSA35141.1 Uncharacterised protein [Vibrio cholerae]